MWGKKCWWQMHLAVDLVIGPVKWKVARRMKDIFSHPFCSVQFKCSVNGTLANDWRANGPLSARMWAYKWYFLFAEKINFFPARTCRIRAQGGRKIKASISPALSPFFLSSLASAKLTLQVGVASWFTRVMKRSKVNFGVTVGEETVNHLR